MRSQAQEAVEQHLIELGRRMAASAPLAPHKAARVAMENYFTAAPLPSVRLLPASPATLKAEWLLDRDVDCSRRMLFLHGGGYVAGGLTAYRHFGMWIAQAMRCAVLLIEYRLAPEHPFPAALEDALTAFRWMREHGPEGPGPAERAFLLGDSAGGGLALATLLALRDRSAGRADAAVTFSAWTDLTNSGESMVSNANPRLGAVKAVPDWFAGLYLAGKDPRDPLASPLFGTLEGLPPLFMQASAAEQFLDDSARFAQKARAAGGEVHLDVWPDMVHVWQGFAPQLPEAIEALRRAGEFIGAI
ncbi:MAG: alpha/beta hydrolase [Steroidobacteraceae bacterium]